jgi:hypothetical protein
VRARLWLEAAREGLGRNAWLALDDARWWVRDRLSGPASAVAALVLVVLGLGGFLLARDVGRAQPVADRYTVLTRTTTRLVKVKEQGRVVTRRVPVVRTLPARAVTVLATETVKTPGGVSVVTRPVVRYRRVYVTRTVGGKRVTVVKPSTRTRAYTVTRNRVQTEVQTQVETQMQTQSRTETVPVTRTQTQTVSRTQTETETVPVTVTRTQTETETAPVTVTQTVTAPAVTVTVDAAPKPKP